MTWLNATNLQSILNTFHAEHRHSEISNDDFKSLMAKAIVDVYGNPSGCAKALELTPPTIRKWMVDGCSVRTTRFTVRNLILQDVQAKLDALAP